MQELNAFLAQPKVKLLSFQWPASLTLAHLNPLPYKYRSSRRMRVLRQQRAARRRGSSSSRSWTAAAEEKNDVTRLKTSFDVLRTLRLLRTRRWELLDLQYLVLSGFIAFSLLITPSAPLIKTGALVAYSILLLMPITQQFFLPSLPIWTYLLYFFSSRFIPTEYRPHIWVKVLPALENVLYGANLSNILSAHAHPVLDVLAWIPYGLGHFALPAVCSATLFLFAAPGTTPAFAKAFGYMSLLGVVIQLTLPCTPPWYEKTHGLEPAHYGMEGSPAGLARIDALLGVDMYTTSFTTAPVPFGAFPSLHSGAATLEAFFMQYAFPRFRLFLIMYVGWIWWATMYLNHHYAVDLVGGSLIAAATYYIVRSRWLPRPQLDKSHRWEYEYVEVGDRPRTPGDEERGYYGLGLIERERAAGRRGDSDEWTIGSSSSLTFESLSHGGDASASSSSSLGSISPVVPDEDFIRYHHIVGITPHGEVWDGDHHRPGRESELTEVVVMR